MRVSAWRLVLVLAVVSSILTSLVLHRPSPLDRLKRAAENGHADRPGGPLFEAARRLGPDSREHLLRVLLERVSSPQVEFHSITQDETTASWVLGQLADTDLRRRMTALLADAKTAEQTRHHLVIALCQPQHADSMDVLVRIAADRHEDPELRHQILVRLPRLPAAAPAELELLLLQPFSDIDLVAAATLARMGNPAAPSLVLKGLGICEHQTFAVHFTAAANALMNGAPKDHSLLPPLRNVRDACEESMRRLKDWLAASVAARETPFERRMQLLRERRAQRKAGPNSMDDVLAAGNKFDLASAALLVADPEDRDATLGALDRLAAHLRDQLASADAPEAKIEVLNYWLIRRHKKTPGDFDHTQVEDERGPSLSRVLWRDGGECLDLSVLYLAMAERLDLPLHGVEAFQHMFVRWDDGSYRRNIETTDGGAPYLDSHYDCPNIAASGLRNLTKRQVLAVILVNRALALMNKAQHKEALEPLEHALALWPESTTALCSRADALYHSTLDRDDQVIEDSERALALGPGELERLYTARRFILIGRTARARQVVAKLDLPEARAVEALALAHERKATAALQIVQSIRQSNLLGPVGSIVRARASPADAERHAREAVEAGASPRFVAKHLLRMDTRLASAALAVLGSSDERTKPVHVAEEFALRAIALWQLGKKAEARDALDHAESLYEGGTSRALLEARSLESGRR